jgi:hypothetical protein
MEGMDAPNDLAGDWFDQGEKLADATDELVEEAAAPNLWVRFGLALAGAGTLIVTLLGIVNALA